MIPPVLQSASYCYITVKCKCLCQSLLRCLNELTHRSNAATWLWAVSFKRVVLVSSDKDVHMRMSKLVCWSFMKSFTRMTVVSWTKERRKVVQNETIFPLVSRFFHCRWWPFILHFSGVITVTLHSFSNLLRSTEIKIFLSFYHLWNVTNCWSSEHHKIQTADVVIFGDFFPSAVTWRTGAAVVWTGDEIIINGTAVMMHHYMHAGGRGFNLVCYRERCDCTLTRPLCLSQHFLLEVPDDFRYPDLNVVWDKNTFFAAFAPTEGKKSLCWLCSGIKPIKSAGGDTFSTCLLAGS